MSFSFRNIANFMLPGAGWAYGRLTHVTETQDPYGASTPKDPNSVQWDPNTFRPIGMNGIGADQALSYQEHANAMAEAARQRYFNDAQGSYNQGLDYLGRYRGGGASAAAAQGLYGRAGLQMQIGDRQQAPDLLSNYREVNRIRAQNEQHASQRLSRVMDVLRLGASVAGAASGNPAALAGAIPPSQSNQSNPSGPSPQWGQNTSGRPPIVPGSNTYGSGAPPYYIGAPGQGGEAAGPQGGAPGQQGGAPGPQGWQGQGGPGPQYSGQPSGPGAGPSQSPSGPGAGPYSSGGAAGPAGNNNNAAGMQLPYSGPGSGDPATSPTAGGYDPIGTSVQTSYAMEQLPHDFVFLAQLNAMLTEMALSVMP